MLRFFDCTVSECVNRKLQRRRIRSDFNIVKACIVQCANSFTVTIGNNLTDRLSVGEKRIKIAKYKTFKSRHFTVCADIFNKAVGNLLTFSR